MNSNVCAVKFCSKFTKGKKSLFRFPKDLERCRQWAMACKCKQLNLQYLYSSYYRVCGIHFQTSMFLNNLQNRLQPNAVPTLFLEEQELAGYDNHLLLLEDNLTSVCSSTKSNDYAAISQKPELTNTATVDMPSYNSTSQTSDRWTQTGSDRTSKCPCKNEIRIRLKKTQRQNYKLKRRIKSLQIQLKAKPVLKEKNVTAEDFKLMCETFLPGKLVANFVKSQVDLIVKK